MGLMEKQEEDQSIHTDLVVNRLLIYLVNDVQEHSTAPAYLFVLIGSHSYELSLREGTVHHHPVGASYTNYVYLGLVFVQRVQHYLQKTEQTDRPHCHSGTPQLLSLLLYNKPDVTAKPLQFMITESRRADAFLLSDKPQD